MASTSAGKPDLVYSICCSIRLHYPVVTGGSCGGIEASCIPNCYCVTRHSPTETQSWIPSAVPACQTYMVRIILSESAPLFQQHQRTLSVYLEPGPPLPGSPGYSVASHGSTLCGRTGILLHRPRRRHKRSGMEFQRKQWDLSSMTKKKIHKSQRGGT